MKERLEISVIQYKHAQECNYCFEGFPSGYEFKFFTTDNREILLFFQKPSTSRTSRRGIRLCQKCFDKLHDLLNELENEGWQTLEESDYEWGILDSRSVLNYGFGFFSSWYLFKDSKEVLKMKEEEMIKILVEFLLQNNQTQIGLTEYDRCIQLMDVLSTKTLNEIHKIWKEKMNGK